MILPAQTSLNWASSFSPTWSNGNTNGNASNVAGSGINAAASAIIVGSGSFQQALGSSGSQTPTVNGATFTVPGISNRLQVTPNYSNNSSYTTITITFTSLVTNVNFRIVDIDKSDANSTTYFDRVTITGAAGSTDYFPSLTKYDAVTDPNFLVISGNTAHANTTNGAGGNSASDATDQLGTVNVNFGTAVINSITIRYDNAPGANSNPASQAIAVGAISFTNSTLPVQLTSFSGHRLVQDVVLDWKTQQEVNAASYEIERNNGSNWITIGSLAANGNMTLTAYRYTDTNPQGSLLLYRLKQIDKDGRFTYSGIIRITGKENKLTLLGYPNPFTEQVTISVHSSASQPVSTFLYDGNGKMVRSETKSLYAGDNSFIMTGLDKLAAGIYYLEIKNESGSLLGRTRLLKK